MFKLGGFLIWTFHPDVLFCPFLGLPDFGEICRLVLLFSLFLLSAYQEDIVRNFPEDKGESLALGSCRFRFSQATSSGKGVPKPPAVSLQDLSFLILLDDGAQCID